MIPSGLETYLELSSTSSLTLVTSILGATSNWLILRILHQALKPHDSELPPEDTAVLLVSFLRDGRFWEDAAQRLGLNLTRLQQAKQYCFINGLSGLFLGEKLNNDGNATPILCSPDLKYISEEIRTAIKVINEGNDRKLLLVIDGVDLLLAAATDVNPLTLEDTIIELREEVQATVLTLSADLPLVTSLQTPLERDHAAFLMSIAHQSDLIMNLRLLDTGIAKDVSGVIRITCKDLDDGQLKHENKEFLYFVGADSKVKLFERGQQ